jgi:RecA/RadA recombinase
MPDDVEEVRKELLANRKKPSKLLTAKDYLSTGSTLLNLACAGRALGGFAKGRYYFIVGDSSAGKTLLALTCFAEATINLNFDDYRLIYDNAEDGAMFDFEKFFGKDCAERVEPPAEDKGVPVFSTTIEEFYYHLDDATKEQKPFVYVLDSMDSLSSDGEGQKFDEQKEAHRKGKDTAGSYGDGKAKINSAGLRKIMPYLRKTGSILIIISQTRDNLGFGFEKKTRSGGRALKFYATVEMWLSKTGTIKKTVKGKERKMGVTTQIEVKKNRITGKERSVEIPILNSIGIDDLGSCIDYLVEERHWKKSGPNISAPEFNHNGSREALIKLIESSDEERKLRLLVASVWNEIEDALNVSRKGRYS